MRPAVSLSLSLPPSLSLSARRTASLITLCAVCAGGGVGLSLAEWMIQGQPTSYPDIFAMDVARYGPWASRAYTLQKSQENYRRRFR